MVPIDLNSTSALVKAFLLGLNRSAMIGEIPLASPFRLSGPSAARRLPGRTFWGPLFALGVGFGRQPHPWRLPLVNSAFDRPRSSGSLAMLLAILHASLRVKRLRRANVGVILSRAEDLGEWLPFVGLASAMPQLGLSHLR